MVSLDLITSFAAAARHSSFAGAARDLGISPSAVAKNIARLEEHLGVRLFHRTTRQVTLSEDGERLHARCRRILKEVESLEEAAVDARSGPQGTLRIDLPVSYGRRVVLPVLTDLLQRHPRLGLDVRFSDQVVDIVKEGIDAAVRIGTLTDSRLIARAFDEQRLLTCASPVYLRDHGRLDTPDDLVHHTCLVFRLPSSGRDRPWQFSVGGDERTLHPVSTIRLGDGEALVQAAAADAGIIQVPEHLVDGELAGGELVEVLSSYRPVPLPVSLVYAGRRAPLRVRVLADALIARGAKVA